MEEKKTVMEMIGGWFVMLWLWLKGKKTYIAVGVSFAIGVWGLYSGHLSLSQALGFIVWAVTLLGLGDKIGTHLSTIGSLLEDVVLLLRALQIHSVVSVIADTEKVATDIGTLTAPATSGASSTSTVIQTGATSA